MADTTKMLIGIDIDSEFTQVSVFNRSQDQPDSVNPLNAEGNLRIPTMPGAFENEEIMAEYLKTLILPLTGEGGMGDVERLVIAVKKPEPAVKGILFRAASLMGLAEGSLSIISRLQSFMYFTVCQNRDIWINDVGLFAFDKDDFIYYRLRYGRKNEPMTIVAERTVLTDTLNYAMLSAGLEDRVTYAFETLTGTLLNRQIISGLYFTGDGFETGWADDILKKLCNGRRVFRGQNICSKGAAIAANMLCEGTVNNYLLIGDEALLSSISMRVYADSEIREFPLADIGQHWSEAGGEVTVIMDGTNELDFIIHNVLKKDFICAIMTLETLDLRADRSVRLKVSLRFADRDTAVITVRDTGFGEFYSNNYRIWEQIIRL